MATSTDCEEIPVSTLYARYKSLRVWSDIRSIELKDGQTVTHYRLSSAVFNDLRNFQFYIGDTPVDRITFAINGDTIWDQTVTGHQPTVLTMPMFQGMAPLLFNTARHFTGFVFSIYRTGRLDAGEVVLSYERLTGIPNRHHPALDAWTSRLCFVDYVPVVRNNNITLLKLSYRDGTVCMRTYDRLPVGDHMITRPNTYPRPDGAGVESAYQALHVPQKVLNFDDIEACLRDADYQQTYWATSKAIQEAAATSRCRTIK